MNLNVILRGQSNAYLFGLADNGAVLAKLEQDVERLLGFDGRADTVTVHFAFDRPGGANTVNSGTGFLGDWIGPQDGDWRDGWTVRGLERGILDYIGGLPAAERDDPAAVLWFHSEFDSQRGGLTAAEWESGVRFDAGLVRAALGQSAAAVPYLFVSAHPYAVWWGQDSDAGHQAIRQGMENLAADAGFNADIAARILDTDINYDNAREYGGGHLSDADQRIAEARMARALAETWAAYAKPGSAVASAGGNIDDHGPRAVGATVVGANQLLLQFSFDAASRLQALDADAARGVGWSVRSASGEIDATAAALSGTDQLLLTFGDAIPAGGKLFYGYGYGRLAEGNTPGQGNAVYDDQGMPAWVEAGGLAVSGGAVVVGPTYEPASVTVGSGPDTLVLSVSQDAYQGSAQYTVSVDGAQVGGTLTASALRPSGQHDTVTVKGDWAAGNHTVAVNFLNDAWGGTAATDRNLYVDGASYNGAAVSGAARTLLSEGAASFGFTEAGTTGGSSGGSSGGTPAAVTVGSGPDALVLRISQDAYQGAAQYTVSVDGVQIGGTLTASALHGGGQPDTVTVKGDWAAGAHTVSVNFLNDAWGGTAATDRNLYVDAATYNGAAVPGATASLMSAGPASFGFTEAGTAAQPSTGGSTGGGSTGATPVAVTVGSGADTLVLSISQDAYQGSAQYTVSVDGIQIGGTLAASALHASGQHDTVTVLGDWAGGRHAVSVSFLNDAWGGTAATDRNLYVDAATYNGAAVPGATASLMSAGPAGFAFSDSDPVAPSPDFPPASLTVGSGADRLVLKVSQDAYQGSAQYTVQVDGRQVGGTLTASALHGGGQSDTVTVLGDWAAGNHTAAVTFLNDAWGGTSSTDRNLYVDSATYNGADVGGAAQTLLSEGAARFGFLDPLV